MSSQSALFAVALVGGLMLGPRPEPVNAASGTTPLRPPSERPTFEASARFTVSDSAVVTVDDVTVHFSSATRRAPTVDEIANGDVLVLEAEPIDIDTIRRLRDW